MSYKTTYSFGGERRPALIALLGGAAVVVAVLAWVAFTAGGNPSPTAPHLTMGAVIVNSGILVFREGLETILVLAAVTASMKGAQQVLRRPIAGGAALALLASGATWIAVVAAISAVNAPELDIQAATGLIAVVVLLVVMNWFFHNVYWRGWINHHNQRRQRLVSLGGDARQQVWVGLILLGFTSVYREGFEVVLFLQNLRLQAGTLPVLGGVAIGLLLSGIVAYITFVAHHRLPYKKMLVLTGVMLGAVLVVMVGESGQELQQAGWISTTNLPIPIPAWVGLWLAVFPTLETLLMQVAAVVLVVGSYLLAEHVRVTRPKLRGETPAHRPDTAPTTVLEAVGTDHAGA
jgi:high-affinity iron transporter